MKDKIYWSILHKNEDFFKDDEDFGMFATMTLVENPDTEFCLVPSQDLLNKSFTTEKEAELYILQLMKPVYFQLFGNAYELVYLEPLSPQFVALMRKREKYMVELFDLVEKLTEEEEKPKWMRFCNKGWNFIREIPHNLMKCCSALPSRK